MKKTLYPKTSRVDSKPFFTITEKIDGSNLCIFKENGNLFVAQRNIVFSEESFCNCTYKGLKEWLNKNKDNLKEELCEKSAICGEWLGTGKIKYNCFSSSFLQFAKANVLDGKLYNFIFDQDFFVHSYKSKVIPIYINLVPIVNKSNTCDILYLDNLYKKVTSESGRSIEGFVLSGGGYLQKYVRHKNGKIQDRHITSEEMLIIMQKHKKK